MRLTQEEVAAIIDAINLNVTLKNAELRLHGSRAKSGKGGDIDLLLVLPDQPSYQLVLDRKIEILLAMKERIGDQKIDFTLAQLKDES